MAIRFSRFKRGLATLKTSTSNRDLASANMFEDGRGTEDSTVLLKYKPPVSYEGMPRSPASPSLTSSPHSRASAYEPLVSNDTPSGTPIRIPEGLIDRLDDAEISTDREYSYLVPEPKHPKQSKRLTISPPAPPKVVRRISELIDPETIVDTDDYVKSPSGNFLGRADFSAREDRPLSLRERQERIRQQSNGLNSYAVNGIQDEAHRPINAFAIYDIPEESENMAPVQPRKKNGIKFLCC